MTARTTVRGLALACHPAPALAVTALAGLLAVTTHAPGRTVVLVVCAILAGQLSIGWANDWLDATRDAAVGRADKPVARGQIGPHVVRTAALGALSASVPLSFVLGVRAGAVHLVAVASGWAYDLGLKATAWSWLPYAVSFGLLPNIVLLAQPTHHFAPWWLWLAGALLGVGAHLVNVLPDLDDDRATGVHGLPHRLGRSGSSVGAALVLTAAAGLVAVGPAGPVPAAARVTVALAVGAAVTAAVTGARGFSRLVPLVATAAVAVATVALLVASGGRLD